MLGRCGSGRRIDLHDRADHHELDVGARARDPVEERDVEPLVDHAEEADDDAVGDERGPSAAPAAEVIGVDAARERVHVRVPCPLRFVQALSAGEDEVGAREELLLLPREHWGSARELGELVHAVVDDEARIEPRGESERHRGVEPNEGRGDLLARQVPIEELALQLVVRPPARRRGEVGREDSDAPFDLRDPDAWRVRAQHRLLHVKDACLARVARHEVLGALENEIPREVGEADDVGEGKDHGDDRVFCEGEIRPPETSPVRTTHASCNACAARPPSGGAGEKRGDGAI